MLTRKWLQPSILLLLGAYFIQNLITGRVTYYIHQNFVWLSAVAGVVFLIFGVLNVVKLWQETKAADTRELQMHSAGDVKFKGGHDHEGAQAPSWFILGVMIFPLLIGLLIPARPLGGDAIGTSGISTVSGLTSSQTNQFSPVDIPSLKRNVLDWVKLLGQSTAPEEFNGEPADVIGFVYHDIRRDGKPYFMVVRFTLACCAADARALGLTVQTANAEELVADSWVRVQGKFQMQEIDGDNMPVLVADTVEATIAPNPPYLYP